MAYYIKALASLSVMLLTINTFLPTASKFELATSLETITEQPVTVSYQRGDEKNDTSETDDGTLLSRYVDGTVPRPTEFQGDGSGSSIVLKRAIETSGGETVVDTQRIAIKFPNILGNGTNQIPLNTEIS